MNTLRLGAAFVSALLLAGCGGNDEPQPGIELEPFDFHVIDYSPAPGQFVNEIPAYSQGDDAAVMATRADQMLHRREMVSLGAWGGSITLSLNRPLYNYDGPDFRILGNAYFSGSDAMGLRYGSSEPGIVYVMCDQNNNGEPDDTWYELRGEGYDESMADYEVTYHRPAMDATDATYIKWTASDGAQGYINRVSSYHLQNFFAEWVGKGDQTFRGRRLPDNGVLDEATGMYRLYNIKGYADSYPNNDDASMLDISMAVDADGNSVDLLYINFIRVVTGVLQTNGNLGECSTEVAGVEFFQ
ncbi:MAG: PKD domain-containing protein [Muribaculaceae bacterium]|nr:PKD domain-containing protein [Muribaculaceae bacterium]